MIPYRIHLITVTLNHLNRHLLTKVETTSLLNLIVNMVGVEVEAGGKLECVAGALAEAGAEAGEVYPPMGWIHLKMQLLGEMALCGSKMHQQLADIGCK